MADREYVEEAFAKAREALADLRQQADYGYAPIDEDIEASRERTHRSKRSPTH